ncbi:MAG: sigma-70 family RNA polymerase sigma factor [Planctomycetaceae bacterium]|nr:sigma-70 family RNA polymerase sigma factor [Planctomycetaceae bacterium]
MPTDPRLADSDTEEGIRAQVNSSFEEIVRLYQADVRIMTRRHFGSLAEADEVAQEIFVQVYRGLPGFRGESSLRTWILGLARNQIRVHIRNESRRRRRSETVVPPELLEAEAVEDVDPYQTDDAQEELDALNDCVTRLGDRQRWLVEAFYYQKKSAEMIASEVSQTAGAVRMLLMRIRKQLADCIRFKVTKRSEDQT